MATLATGPWTSRHSAPTGADCLIPPGWPYKEALHCTWADPYRADTVEEFLGSGRMFTVADMVELQNSVFSIPVRELVPFLREIHSPKQATPPARQRLLAWDFHLDQNSAPAGIYEMWQRHIQADVRARFVPREAQAFIGIPPLSKIIHWMEAPDGRFGPDPIAGAMHSCSRAWMKRSQRSRSGWARTWKRGSSAHTTMR
jgi:penicillin amidase